MRIGGLHKTTLLDFPGKVSALIFTQGCNFHCPYCHNPDLLAYNAETVTQEDVITFLQSRRAVLEGVVLSGGEPTLQADLQSFCAAIKNLGYAVKLDTNGSNPQVLKQLLQAGLVDYVAMDIKANPAQYAPSLCAQEQAGYVLQSIAVLEKFCIPHEFRFPCAAPFLSMENFPAVLACIAAQGGAAKNKAPLFLQKINLKHVLNPKFFCSEGHPLEEEELFLMQQYAQALGFMCSIR